MATSASFLPVTKSELDLFKPPAVQVSQVDYQTIYLKPINSVSSSSRRLEFFHPGKNTDFYRNLKNTFLYLKFKVCKPDGTPLDTSKDVSLINYFGQTFIKSIEVHLNGTQITRNSSNYAYRAYIEALLTCNTADLGSSLAAAGFYLDTGAGTEITGFDKTKNLGLAKRLELIKESKECEFIARLHTDIGNSHRYLPNGIDLAINFDLNPDHFVLMGGTGVTAADATVSLIDATLMTEICHLNPAVQNAIERVLQSHNAIIPIQTREVHAINLPANQTSYSVDNLITGKLGSVHLFMLTANSSFAGKISENPLAFIHQSLININVVVNGVQHAIGPFDFATNLNYVRGYHSLLRAAGLVAHGESPLVTLDNYKDGYAIFGIDLSAEGTAASLGSHSSTQKVGNLRLELLFTTAPASPLTLLVYSLQDGGSVEIDKIRNIYVSF
jgi:hypothetical protein